jgi:K+-transporting ATPase KdpF subunit
MLRSIVISTSIWKARAKEPMNTEYIISGIIAVLLLGYLTYAMLKPERF